MATARKKTYRHPIPVTLREFFICSECGKASEYMQDPVVLPCLHVACTLCLEGRVRGSAHRDVIECPACTRRAAMPQGGIRAFPEDTFSRTAIKTLTNPEFAYLPGGPSPRCGLHPEQDVSHYCHRCHTQLCLRCCHREHAADIESLTLAASKLDQELQAAISDKLQEVAASTASVKDSHVRVNADINQVAQQIKDRAQQLIEQIIEHREENLQQLQYFRQQHDQPFLQALGKLDTLQSKVLDYKRYVAILHERGMDFDKTAHAPGLQELVQRQIVPQPPKTLDVTHKVRFDCPIQEVDLTDLFGRLTQPPVVGLFEGLKHRYSVPVSCEHACRSRYITLLGHDHVMHSYERGPNTSKLCIHNVDGSIKKLVTIPQIATPLSGAVIDPEAGSLVVADTKMTREPWSPSHRSGTVNFQSQGKPHRNGALHWVTLSLSLDVVKHVRTELQCMPTGHVNVDSSGQVLVLTRCESNRHQPKLTIYNPVTHTEMRTVHLPDTMRYPLSAVNSANGIYTIADSDVGKVVWLDQKGMVLKSYGDEAGDRLSAPRHVIQHSEGSLLISDYHNSKLHLVSRDGVLVEHLLQQEKQHLPHVVHPQLLHLDEQAGRLAVSCREKTVMVFEFSSPVRK